MSNQENQPPRSNGDPPNKDKKESRSEQARNYMKYSGLAIQMGIIILIGTYLGQRLDARFQTKKPYLTVLCALLSIFAALYIALKDLFAKDQ